MDIKKYINTHFDEVLKSIIEIIRIKTVKADRAGDLPADSGRAYLRSEW